MKWRDVILGALITLAVTVIGGVIVYYTTRQPAHPAPHEHLVYQVEQPTNFDAKQEQFSLFTLRFANIGDKSAQQHP